MGASEAENTFSEVFRFSAINNDIIDRAYSGTDTTAIACFVNRKKPVERNLLCPHFFIPG